MSAGCQKLRDVVLVQTVKWLSEAVFWCITVKRGCQKLRDVLLSALFSFILDSFQVFSPFILLYPARQSVVRFVMRRELKCSLLERLGSSMTRIVSYRRNMKDWLDLFDLDSWKELREREENMLDRHFGAEAVRNHEIDRLLSSFLLCFVLFSWCLSDKRSVAQYPVVL